MVSEDVTSDGWCVRGKRSRRFQTLYNQTRAEPIPDGNLGDDIVMWKKGEDDYQDKFVSSSTWEQIRSRKDKVHWRQVVWFSQGFPRYAFITWLAVLNKLSIGDRMRSWSIILGCGLCGERDETRDHLFFACPYSFTVSEGLV